MPRVFSKDIISEAQKNLETKGLNKSDVKDILVVMSGHFNDEVEDIKESLYQFRTVGTRINTALWAIDFSLIGSLIAALIVFK